MFLGLLSVRSCNILSPPLVDIVLDLLGRGFHTLIKNDSFSSTMMWDNSDELCSNWNKDIKI